MQTAIFQEHRFAFFYWLHWFQSEKFETSPALVSLDWHQDLCYPCESEKEALAKLNIHSDADIAEYAWSKLGGNNDDHILSAAYLDIIGDVYVHCRQEPFPGAWEDEFIQDVNGKTHIIKKFKTIEALEKHLAKTEVREVFFDIDLDFFTINNHSEDIHERFTYMDEKEIMTSLDPSTAFMQWILQRIVGFTIATEPKHCGGILQSNRFLKIVNDLFFEGELLSENCSWNKSF